MEHAIPLLALIGIIIEGIGFVLMLYYWREPMQRDVETWKSTQIKSHPKDYENRIKDDWNWYRLPSSDQSDPRSYWMVPKGFGIYWMWGKRLAFGGIIGGLILQGVQLLWF